MLHMERARIAELVARGFGKTAKAKTDAEPTAPADATAQTQAIFWASKARTRGEQKRRKRLARVACPHAVKRWKQVPHPRYGDRVPFFVSYLEPLADTAHDCIRDMGR
jgi:hypothetical protein